ncbi:MAG: hypothetical protein AB1765_11825 [Candidatus Hydrogenedentota bacterium]
MMLKFCFTLIIVSLLFFILLIFNSAALPFDAGKTSVYVSDIGNSSNPNSGIPDEAYNSITKALEYLSPDNGFDTIIVYSSVSPSYYEQIDLSHDTGITLISFKALFGTDSGPGGDVFPIIQYMAVAPICPTGVILIISKYCSLKGFIIDGANNSRFGIFLNWDGENFCRIENNIIRNITGPYPGGCGIWGGEHTTIIKNNEIYQCFRGVSNSGAYIIDNYIHHNKSGIFFGNSAGSVFNLHCFNNLICNNDYNLHFELVWNSVIGNFVTNTLNNGSYGFIIEDRWGCPNEINFNFSKNNFFNNSSNAYNQDISESINISRSFWNTTSSNPVTMKIDLSGGQIYFIPYRFNYLDTAIGADTVAPAIPTGLTSNTSRLNQIKILWDSVITNEEAGGYLFNLNGYRIFRYTQADTSNWYTTIIGSVPPNQTFFIDNNVKSNQIYYYRVTAFDTHLTNGVLYENESWFSDTIAVSIPELKDTFVKDEILVKFKEQSIEVRGETEIVVVGPSQQEIDDFNSSQGVTIKYYDPILKFYQLKIPANKTVEEMIQIYESNHDVKYAEPNYIAEIY